MASPQSQQGEYKAVSIVDAETTTLSDIPLLDLQNPLESPALSARIAPEGKTPTRIQASGWHYTGHGMVDAMLSLGPVFFFILAAICLSLNGKPVSPFGEDIKAITLVSPTIFPIIYAAILGKFLRRLGLYKVERGITIGNLERLIGCQSIFSTVERQFGLRRFDFLGFVVLFAWLLSPLGGQASLRLLSKGLVEFKGTYSLMYFPMERYISQTTLPSILPEGAQSSNLYAPLFTAALQNSRGRLRNPMDLFGNVRIPHLGSIAVAQEDGTKGKWLWVENTTDIQNMTGIQNTTNIQYTSIFGVSTAGLPDSGSASFNLVSHYWLIDCPTTPSKIQLPWHYISQNETTIPQALDRLSPSFGIVLDEGKSFANNISFAYQTRRAQDVFQSLSCFASIVIVESKVGCRDKACIVRAVRAVNHNASEPWGNGVTPLTVFRAIGKALPGVDISITQNGTLGSELVERWILSPDLANAKPGFVFLENLEANLFTQRLMMIINTFWDSTVESLERTEPRTMDQYLAQLVIKGYPWNETELIATQQDGLKYVCNITLAALTMIISALLLLAATLSMLLGIMARTPDMLGFVSVSARDNPYFSAKTLSSYSGLEAARELQHVRVKIGDIRGDNDVGHIAFTTSDKKPRRLSWSRYYD
ncbi:hypothetical protein IQ07DRAFT_593355 [Pyrenochaeta sp. DS3sAY3a]|nr:hypothetical protein IQ07DRAFT_593355 [Pyrenochaeta sp. DS3sAY3a]